MGLDSWLAVGNGEKEREQGDMDILSLDKWNADVTINKCYFPF